MKNIIFVLIFFCCFFSCNSDDPIEEVELLKYEIKELQSEIRFISNQLEAYSLQGLSYSEAQVSLEIDEFVEKRIIQASKVEILETKFNEAADYEIVECGDFDSNDCFIENWDIRISEGATVEVTPDCTYNTTTSLRLSAPFIDNEFNIPGLEIEGYINGIEASTIYKVRFWMRYSGISDLSNGPLTYMIVLQDGEWLDYLYEGFHSVNENKVVDKDWELYSFQIATLSDSPLEIIFGTNLDDVCIDDIHIVKKEQ